MGKESEVILLADSGSTKTDWALLGGKGRLVEFQTAGINPFYQSEEDIRLTMREVLPYVEEEGVCPAKVYFYGAGCAFPEKNRLVEAAVAGVLHAPCEVQSDLLAAARALCGHRPGIACILGTGSNSCFYDGQEMAANVPPLGYILGDEGSGAVLGKRLVADCLKGVLPRTVQERFFKRFGLSRQEVMDRVYKQPFPNRFLASLSPFLLENMGEPSVRAIVLGCFRAFFRRNVMQYDFRHHAVHFTGSVAWHYRVWLEQVAREEGVSVGSILPRPMEGLVRYHLEGS